MLNIWKYQHEAVVSEFGVGALRETKVGGQLGFDEDVPQEQQLSYGTRSETDRASAYNKTSYTFPGKPYQSIGAITSVAHHLFDSAYGLRN